MWELASRETLAWSIFSLKAAEKALLHIMLCTMGWFMVSCAPSSGRPSLHCTLSASGRRKMAVSGREGCTLARQILQHRTLHPSLLLLPGNSNFWTDSPRPTLPLSHCVTLHHTMVAAGLQQCGQAKDGACGAAPGEAKVGEFAPLFSIAGRHTAPPCSCFWVPAALQSCYIT